MYYKITNTESEVFKRLKELRERELRIEDENEQAIKDKTGLTYDSFLGHSGQQNFRRVTQYSGFEFKETDKIDTKIWSESKEHKGIYVPNRRTKLGREMSQFLANGLKGSMYRYVFEILNINIRPAHRFTYPYVEIVDDMVIIANFQNPEPKDENVIEITSKEFECIRQKLAIV